MYDLKPFFFIVKNFCICSLVKFYVRFLIQVFTTFFKKLLHFLRVILSSAKVHTAFAEMQNKFHLLNNEKKQFWLNLFCEVQATEGKKSLYININLSTNDVLSKT